MDLIYLFIGLAVGSAFTYFLTKALLSKGNVSFESELNQKSGTISQLQSDNLAIKDQLSLKEKSINELTAQLSSRESDLIHLNKRLDEQKEEVLKLQQHFKEEFKNLANDILEEKAQKFTVHNKEKIGEILKPLSDKIKDFEKKVEDTYDKSAQQRHSLREELKRLNELNLQVSKDTVNLTNALKGDSKTQGDWGEMILESILEQSGLVEDREYFKQTNFKTEEGKNVRPDFIVKYPGERNVVIDSKVSLTAYDRYMSAETDKEREKAINEHLLSIRNHVKELSEVKYQDLYGLNSLDFVMMFMPIEPSYMLAMQHDAKLWQDAYSKRVLIISPTNLIAALKMVESLWKQEYQGRNVQEIARQSGLLYDKFEGFVKDLIELGKKLKDADKYYESSMNKLSTGRGNLVKKVEDIKKLGAKASKELPQKLIERAMEESDEE